MIEDEVLQAVAQSREDAETLARLIERHWGLLLRSDVPLLVRSLATVADDAIADSHPSLVLVGEILQRLTPSARARGDRAIERVIAEIDAVEDPVARVGIGLSAQIALRRRGRFELGRAFGERCIEAAIGLGDPGQVTGGIPIAAIELETGLVHLLGGHLTGATRHFAAAHHHHSPDPSHAHDAAGKLGLLHALRGESSLAASWLREADRLAASSAEWHFGAAQRQGIKAAQMLLAIDRLDWSAYHEHNASAATDYSTENWAWVLYARARAALLLGNQRSVLEEISNLRSYLPHLFEPRGLIAALLDSAESDLRLSQGEIDAALSRSSQFTGQPVELASTARIHLLQGEPEAAGVITAEVGWPGQVSRRERTDLLLLSVGADLAHRPHTAERQRALRRIADELAVEAEPMLFTLAINDPLAVEQLSRHAPSAGYAVAMLNKLDPPRPLTINHPPSKLTPRETVLLQHLASAASMTEIASNLHVTESTIRNHRKSLYRKLRATSRTHALEIARRHGLVR